LFVKHGGMILCCLLTLLFCLYLQNWRLGLLAAWTCFCLSYMIA
jgi:hypothetical protein